MRCTTRRDVNPTRRENHNEGFNRTSHTMLHFTASYELRQVVGSLWALGTTGEALLTERNGSNDGDG